MPNFKLRLNSLCNSGNFAMSTNKSLCTVYEARILITFNRIAVHRKYASSWYSAIQDETNMCYSFNNSKYLGADL